MQFKSDRSSHFYLHVQLVTMCCRRLILSPLLFVHTLFSTFRTLSGSSLLWLAQLIQQFPASSPLTSEPRSPMNAIQTPHLASHYLARLISGVISTPPTPAHAARRGGESSFSEWREESQKDHGRQQWGEFSEPGCELWLCHVIAM